MTAPNSAERKACWNSRDLLWKCLDDNADKAACCQKFQSEFEATCPAQWVNCPIFVTLWSLRSVCRHALIIFFIFPDRWSISPRGETSWNTKRRWRQKASHLLKAPGSLPNHWTADYKSLQTDRLFLFRSGPEVQDFERNPERHHYCYLFVQT